MKTVKGYNFSRDFMGERVPQHVQNIVIKDFCNKNNLSLQLSATEYVMKDSFLIFHELISNINDLHGVVSYSLFLMPENDGERTKIFKKIIKKKKSYLFCC
jgi:sporadic carbohydrate cluster protein (TIGR04323 family)